MTVPVYVLRDDPFDDLVESAVDCTSTRTTRAIVVRNALTFPQVKLPHDARLRR